MDTTRNERSGRREPVRSVFNSGRGKSLVGLLAFLAVLVAFLPASGADQVGPQRSATEGAAWLGRQLDSQIPLDLFGSADWGVTLDAATAVASIDVENPLIATVWAAVVANRESVVSKDGSDIPGALAKVILLAHATGRNPRAVGTGPGADLVARLEGTLQPSGLFGTQFPNYDGVYRQGLALAALGAVGVVPSATAVQWLLDQQCKNPGFEGAYMTYRADTSVDCVDDPDAWLGADSNSTALAVSGLIFGSGDEPTSDDATATARDQAVQAALDWLASNQDPTGGWSANSWTDPDPNSTAVVVQALIAADVLAEHRFNGKERVPQAFLMGFQLGSSAPESDRGSFSFTLVEPAPNLLATVQAVPALATRALVFDGSKDSEEQGGHTTTTITPVPAPIVTTTVATSVDSVPQAPAVPTDVRSGVARRISFTG